MNTLQPSLLLSRALLVDGLAGACTGVSLVLASDWWGAFLQLPSELLFGAGLTLLPLAAFLLWLGSRATLNRYAIWAVLAINALWVIDSVLLLLSGWVAPNLIGYLFLGAQAALVALFFELELIGLRRSQPLPA